MKIILFLCFFILGVLGKKDDFRTIELDYGVVKGYKYWNGDYFQYYGIPYASVPEGRDKFKAPLPPKPWTGTLEATTKGIACPQIFYSGEDLTENNVVGIDDCLTLNIFSPRIANENNLVPVVAYIHSGAFAIGDGNMASYHYLARHDIVVVSFNYRLGALGFACLKNDEIPGNAGLKDQAAALKWINENIEKFGGDPTKVTLAGFSVGAAMAELHAFSPLSRNYFNKIILDSGTALASWAINNDPIDTAFNVAVSIGYNKTKNINDLTEFYLTTPVYELSEKSLNFFLKNGTFGFAPCIEKKGAQNPFITESPLSLLKKRDSKIAVLTGFSNMEGLSRISQYAQWKDEMDESLENFLPTDISLLTKDNIEIIKTRYFKDTPASSNMQTFVDYFSDSMFKYPIMKSAKLHAGNGSPVFLYEFSYYGKLSTGHDYMNDIRGASHRDQTAYILDFYSWTRDTDDMNTRDRLTIMWADFVKFGDPTAYESSLVDYKWRAYTNSQKQYLHINRTVEVKEGLFEDGFLFWNGIYEKCSPDIV